MLNRIKRLLILSALDLACLILKKVGTFDLANEEPNLVNDIGTLTVMSREEYIISQCIDKRVLHLGCTAFPFTRQRIKQDTLLHSNIERFTSSLVGLDNAKEGVEILRNELGMKDIHLLDVYDLCKLSYLDKFDVIIAGEVIEHLENPGFMLIEAARLLKENGIVLATVPNAFKYRNLFATQREIEIVNREHTAWYSPRTIRRLLERCGYSEVAVLGYVNTNNWIGRRFLKQSTLFCDGFLVQAKL